MDHAACSLDEPHPKFFPATKISPLYSGLFKTKSGFGFDSSLFTYRQSRKRFLPNPSFVVAFRKRAGIIWSVSIFSTGKGTNVDVSIVNAFMPQISFVNSLTSV